MKKFVIQVLLFSALLLTSIVLVFLMANGKSDPYYIRFTTPRQHSLIIGTSRAAQGLQPSVFDEIIYTNKEHHFFNYSFSLFDSPYGPAYYESIKNKLDPHTRDGIFIVTVDPWGLSGTKENSNDSVNFMENKSFIGKTKFVNLNPNIPYLIKSFSGPYINIIRRWRQPADMYLHKDGWIDIDVPMDSIAVAKRLAVKLADYRKNFLPVYKFSAVRLRYLTKTIDFLQQHGKVYLVRLPVHQSMFDIEKELMPDFNNIINEIARRENVEYLNLILSGNDYQYVDGNHLYKSSGKKVSYIIANWIAGKKQ